MTNMPYELEALQSRVRLLENEIAFLYKHLDLPYERESEGQPVIEMINNNMMEAFKLYRQIHVCGMDEAKAGVQELRETLRY